MHPVRRTRRLVALRRVLDVRRHGRHRRRRFPPEIPARRAVIPYCRCFPAEVIVGQKKSARPCQGASVHLILKSENLQDWSRRSGDRHRVCQCLCRDVFTVRRVLMCDASSQLRLFVAARIRRSSGQVSTRNRDRNGLLHPRNRTNCRRSGLANRHC